MINLSEHIVEIDGKQYVPYHIAVEALNNVVIEQQDETLNDLQSKFNDAIQNLKNINLDD
jgi:hypothetical protein